MRGGGSRYLTQHFIHNAAQSLRSRSMNIVTRLVHYVFTHIMDVRALQVFGCFGVDRTLTRFWTKLSFGDDNVSRRSRERQRLFSAFNRLPGFRISLRLNLILLCFFRMRLDYYHSLFISFYHIGVVYKTLYFIFLLMLFF